VVTVEDVSLGSAVGPEKDNPEDDKPVLRVKLDVKRNGSYQTDLYGQMAGVNPDKAWLILPGAKEPHECIRAFVGYLVFPAPPLQSEPLLHLVLPITAAKEEVTVDWRGLDIPISAE